MLDDIRKTEVWAIGMTLFALLSGHSLYEWVDHEIQSQVQKRTQEFDKVVDIIDKMPNKSSDDDEFIHFCSHEKCLDEEV